MTASDQPTDMDDRSGQDFEEHRAVLFTLAYSMLGSAAEAEDIVQETWLRRQRVREPVRQERALLCRIATRLALNALRSEANRKESYLGPWLPEPVATEADLADDLILAETVSEATLMVLETLSPAERAAFLLVEVFSLSSAETGRIIDASDTAVRQLVHRARTRLQEGRTHRRANPSPELWTELTSAIRSGDLAATVRLLAPEAVLVSDGGGRASAARRPVRGAKSVARFLIGIAAKMPQFDVTPAWLNGELAAVASSSENVEFVVFLVASETGVQQVLIVRNPDKLMRIDKPVKLSR